MKFKITLLLSCLFLPQAVFAACDPSWNGANGTCVGDGRVDLQYQVLSSCTIPGPVTVAFGDVVANAQMPQVAVNLEASCTDTGNTGGATLDIAINVDQTGWYAPGIVETTAANGQPIWVCFRYDDGNPPYVESDCEIPEVLVQLPGTTNGAPVAITPPQQLYAYLLTKDSSGNFDFEYSRDSAVGAFSTSISFTIAGM